MNKPNRSFGKPTKIFATIVIFCLFFVQTGIPNATLPIAKKDSNAIGDLNHNNGSPVGTAAFREDKTIYSKQLINDPYFDLPFGTSPWTATYEGDTRDVNANLVGNQVNSTIIGNQTSFRLFSNPPQASDWTMMRNPIYVSSLYPQWSGVDSPMIDAYGPRANHTWTEGANQAPSVWWVRNVSAPVNMSDYVITSANISAIFNASVNRNVDVLNINLDAPEGTNPASPQGPPFDFVRFYVKIADINLNNIYEIAYNRTSDLGWYNVTIPIDRTSITDTYLTTVTQDALIFYLNQVLAAYDYQNFTIIIGIDIYCADNCNSDSDTFNMLRLKSVDLNFTCQKKVDQNAAINWAETGYRINSTDYLGTGDQVDVSILNATLNFRYKLTQPWNATASPNSEFRVYINNYLHTETVKLSNGTTSDYQDILGGQGFDVSSLVIPDQNVTVRLQIILLDTFLLSQNCSILIDNVTLNVYFLATVRTTIPDTQLQLVGSTNIAVPWNESFSVIANYTRIDTGAGIAGANITLTWVDDSNVTDIGNGLYNITCNNSITSANQHYNLHILAEAYGNETKTYIADIQILDRPTHLGVFIDNANVTSNPDVTVPWNHTINITAIYYDTLNTNTLMGASAILTGTEIGPGSYQYNEIGDAYEFLVNSSIFGSGSHFISLLASKGNYSVSSMLITVRLTVRPAYISIFQDGVNKTLITAIDVPITGSLSFDINYYDAELGTPIEDYNVSVQGLASSYYTITPGVTTNLNINTEGLALGLYIVPVLVGNPNYTQISQNFQLNVRQINANVSTIDNQLLYTVLPNGNLEITLVVYDTDFNRSVYGCQITYTSSLGSGNFTEVPGTGTYKAEISNIPAGQNALYIFVYKNQNYRFNSVSINIVASAAEGLPPWVIWILVGALITLSVLFIQYQRVWRYPPHIRKIRTMVRDIKNKKVDQMGTGMTFRSAESSLASEYLSSAKQDLSLDTQNQLKTKYMSKKTAPAESREVSGSISHAVKSPESTTGSFMPPKETPAEKQPPTSPTTNEPSTTLATPPVSPLPQKPIELPKEKQIPLVKTLPQIKELPAKPATKPASKPEEKTEENAGNEQK